MVTHLSLEILPPPPTRPGGTWEIFRVFEGAIRPLGWGILKNGFAHSLQWGRWGFDSCLVSSLYVL